MISISTFSSSSSRLLIRLWCSSQSLDYFQSRTKSYSFHQKLRATHLPLSRVCETISGQSSSNCDTYCLRFTVRVLRGKWHFMTSWHHKMSYNESCHDDMTMTIVPPGGGIPLTGLSRTRQCCPCSHSEWITWMSKLGLLSDAIIFRIYTC